MSDESEHPDAKEHEMSSGRRTRLDRKTAEQILRGDPAAWRAAGPLIGPLAAATAAAYSGELAGESAAVAAFRTAAQLGPVTSSGRRSMIKIALAKLLTLKVAAVLAATAAGGVALAAGNGVLPPFTDSPPATGPGQDGPAGDGSNRPGATPSPSLLGLCQAYAAGANKDAVLANPAFSVLVNAAGGVENIEDYCATLPETESGRGTPPSGVPATPPGQTNHPTGAPAGVPTGPPDGLPDSPPVTVPPTAPTSRPSPPGN